MAIIPKPGVDELALSVLDMISVDVILVDMILLRLDIKMFINKVRLVI